MNKDEDGKIVLSKSIILSNMIENLLKEGIINFQTYQKAVKEVETNGTYK